MYLSIEHIVGISRDEFSTTFRVVINKMNINSLVFRLNTLMKVQMSISRMLPDHGVIVEGKGYVVNNRYVFDVVSSLNVFDISIIFIKYHMPRQIGRDRDETGALHYIVFMYAKRARFILNSVIERRKRKYGEFFVVKTMKRLQRKHYLPKEIVREIMEYI